MKILIVSQYFWPESFRINDLAIELKKIGHEVSVLTGLPNYPSGKWFSGYGLKSSGENSWEGINVMRVPILPRINAYGWQLALNYISFAVTASVLGPLLCKARYDIIFTYEPSPFTVGVPAIVMRFFKKAPMIFWVQDLWPESLEATGAVKSRFILNIVGKMVKWIYQRCDSVLLQSEAFVKPAISAGAKPELITYFPNWAEDIYQPLGKPEAAKINKLIPEGFIIMFAGNLGEAQALETIIKTANKLRNIKKLYWMIIGDGRKMQWMQNEVSKLQLDEQIHFLGRHPMEEMPGFFACADVMLVTLKNKPVFSLTIPSKVQTYMACAKPILASINGEGARIINDSGSGIAVEAENSEALSRAVIQMYEKTGIERKKMGDASYAYYKDNYEKKYLIKKLEKILKDKVNNNL